MGKTPRTVLVIGRVLDNVSFLSLPVFSFFFFSFDWAAIRCVRFFVVVVDKMGFLLAGHSLYCGYICGYIICLSFSVLSERVDDAVMVCGGIV